MVVKVSGYVTMILFAVKAKHHYEGAQRHRQLDVERLAAE